LRREGRDGDPGASERLLILIMPAGALAALAVSPFEPRLVPLLLFGGPCAALAARPLRGLKAVRFAALVGLALLVLSTVVMFLRG